MIGKVVRPGRGFKGLASYLLKGARAQSDGEKRVDWIETRNVLVDDPMKVAGLMRATAAKSRRVEKPVYHFVISWRAEEKITADMQRQVADRTCEHLGMADLQTLMVAHNDTDHRHVHILVNRVHPETGVAWRTSKDYARIEQSLKAQALELGIAHVPGRHNGDGDKFRDVDRRPRTAERRMAEKEGRGEARGRWSRERMQAERVRLGAIFKTARSWNDLEQRLAQEGMDVERKGQGIVVADEDGEMKLSELMKEIRLNQLEERFGQTFEDYRPRVRPDKRRTEHSWSGEDDDPEEVQRLHGQYLQLTQAMDAKQLAFALHGLGLVSLAQLNRAKENVTAAKELVDRNLPLLDRLLALRDPNSKNAEPSPAKVARLVRHIRGEQNGDDGPTTQRRHPQRAGKRSKRSRGR